MRWPVVCTKATQRRRASSHAATTTNDEHIPAPWPWPWPPHQVYFTGFGSLPLDPFLSIVELAISVESEFSFSPAYDVRALLAVNAVCRHWRWSALNSPSLWAYIPLHLPLGLVQTFLRRSGDVPLHVDMAYVGLLGHPEFGYSPRDEGGLRRREGKFVPKLVILLPHSHRIRYLSLKLSVSALKSRRVYHELVAGPSCRTPALEGLRFYNSTNYRVSPLKEAYVLNLERSIFKKFWSPVLRELHLDGVVLPHDFIPVMSLSRLSLALTGAGGVATKYLRDVLNGGGCLVALSLNLWTLGADTGFGDGNPISLPQLRVLALNGSYDKCLLVRRMLSTPSLEEIQLKTRRFNLDNAEQFISSTPPGNRVHIEVDHRAIRLKFSGTFGRSHSFIIALQYDSGFTNYNQLLLLLLKRHHFAAVEFLDLSTWSRFDLTFLPSLLSHFGTLQSLRMSFTGGSPWKFPIQDVISLSTLRSPSSPLRSLQSLVFRNFAVTMPQAGPFFVELQEMVRGREGSGLPPLVPEFENCRTTYSPHGG